jgi:hypothetical protein
MKALTEYGDNAMKPNVFYRFVGWVSGIPAEQLACKHPAIEGRLNLLPEEEAWDAYEKCLNCGKEWHDKRKT